MWPQTLIFEYQNVNSPNGGNNWQLILLADQQLCKSNKDRTTKCKINSEFRPHEKAFG